MECLRRTEGLGSMWAGVTCHAWSAEGSNEGQAHDSEIPLAVWMAERLHMFETLKEDLAFLECTPRFPAQERLEALFGDKAHIFSWHDGPEWHGWPHRRKRVLAAIVNKATLEWHGSFDLDELKEQYAEKFYRQMVSPGDLLLQASEDERCREMMKLAIARKNNVTLEEMQDLVARKDLPRLSSLVFPPGGIQRLQGWMQLYKDKMKEGGKLRAFLCDVDHSVGGKGH